MVARRQGRTQGGVSSADDYDVDDPGGWHQVLDGDQKLGREIGHRPL